jgi:hypothetical protein
MRNKIAIAVIGVLLAAGIGILIYLQQNTKQDPLWSHVPASIDQVMITNYVSTSNLPQQVRGLKQSILAQDNDTNTSLLFVQADDNFSTQEFLSAFASGGQVQYSFDDIGDNLYVYAPPAVLDLYKTMSGEFFAIPNIQETLNKITEMQHITVSRVDPERAQIPDPQIAAFAQNLAYMIVWFGAKKEVEAYLVYKDAQTTIASDLDISQRKDYFSSSTLIGLVLDNVFGQAGYMSGDVLESMQYYMSSYGLTTEQLDTVVQTLAWSIGMFIYADDEFQIGGQVVIPNTDIYPIINTVLSKAQNSIASSLGLLPEQVSSTTGEDLSTYTLKPVGVSPLVLLVSKDDEKTSIILNTVMTGQTTNTDTRDDKAFALVSIDVEKLQAFIMQAQTLFGIGGLDDLMPSWMVWRLQWALYQETTALHFVWQLQ